MKKLHAVPMSVFLLLVSSTYPAELKKEETIDVEIKPGDAYVWNFLAIKNASVSGVIKPDLKQVQPFTIAHPNSDLHNTDSGIRVKCTGINVHSVRVFYPDSIQRGILTIKAKELGHFGFGFSNRGLKEIKVSITIKPDSGEIHPTASFFTPEKEIKAIVDQ